LAHEIRRSRHSGTESLVEYISNVRSGSCSGNAVARKLYSAALHEARVHDSNARRNQTHDFRICAERHNSHVSHADETHAVQRAPYGIDKYPAKLGPSEHFVKAGYIFVNQDVRGRFASEGEFIQVTPHIVNKTKPTDVDESSDTYDTIEWLLKNVPNHNGRVGMYGISYPGFYAAAGMIDAHPALKAVSPQAPVGDWYFDDFLHHGSFFLAHAFKWLSANAAERSVPTTEPAKPYIYPMSDGYKMFLEAGSVENIDKLYLKGTIPFWQDMMQHPNRDEFWQKRALPSPEKRCAGRDDGHWLVRCRRPLWIIQDVSIDREAKSKCDQRSGRRSVASRRLVICRWR
jgi:hypothetical protein